MTHPHDPAVTAFIAALDHPHKPALEVVREALLAADPTISEGIKWNAPSFRTTEWFATFHLRGKGAQDRLWLILHTGAKVGEAAKHGLAVEDPAGLLDWLAKDRARVVFADLADAEAKREDLQALIRSWIRVVNVGE
jgi:hypothetical protein